MYQKKQSQYAYAIRKSMMNWKLSSSNSCVSHIKSNNSRPSRIFEWKRLKIRSQNKTWFWIMKTTFPLPYKLYFWFGKTQIISRCSYDRVSTSARLLFLLPRALSDLDTEFLSWQRIFQTFQLETLSQMHPFWNGWNEFNLYIRTIVESLKRTLWQCISDKVLRHRVSLSFNQKFTGIWLILH